jgi:hypothetical protein
VGACRVVDVSQRALQAVQTIAWNGRQRELSSAATLFDTAQIHAAAKVNLTASDLREIEDAAAMSTVQGARYPEHLQRRVGR